MKYTKLELFFANRWQWVRKRSKQMWIRPKEEGYMWTKMFPEMLYFYDRGDLKRNDYDIEDWR